MLESVMVNGVAWAIGKLEKTVKVSSCCPEDDFLTMASLSVNVGASWSSMMVPVPLAF
jgi:hypothetical protein